MNGDKFALVTGAGSGIGKRIALALIEDGYTVALAGRRRDALEATAQEGRRHGDRALVVPTDVSSPEAVDRLFDEIRRSFGRLDLLFNNAGIFARPASLEDLDYQDWKAAVDINLTGAFLCIQGAFRIMKTQSPQGGRIINNGSISAHAPRPHAVSYTATKHAITGLTKAASLDGRAYNIACGQIDIGNAASEMTAVMNRGVLQADGSTRPEPLMDTEHVARAVLYMASLPLDANVQFMTVMATKMPYIGRG
ncbi:SDR family oxidoreductase [Parapusillimonas granuli]|uniref:SDR family oxidoreductase n=1 Tax=Parapusillimonas granuli TaxID=380911 RepID=A0A853FSY5_9BURK|nr:SDR family oxidoreductase [Parapusillimonas granuli]MBB5214617.1 NAD(P)-dependent dehydrogenase (short-subunit alcohol dehydrogenase family) [Parapusillimonas granuli]MEB2398135.1 SDR family NAD(P)-dependent oxidoreductase [Alcaligenaceae bacterium]NYT48975.1 SDR family oxidoreductase [Parapusillimonas granuli]